MLMNAIYQRRELEQKFQLKEKGSVQLRRLAMFELVFSLLSCVMSFYFSWPIARSIIYGAYSGAIVGLLVNFIVKPIDSAMICNKPLSN